MSAFLKFKEIIANLTNKIIIQLWQFATYMSPILILWLAFKKVEWLNISFNIRDIFLRHVIKVDFNILTQYYNFFFNDNQWHKRQRNVIKATLSGHSVASCCLAHARITSAHTWPVSAIKGRLKIIRKCFGIRWLIFNCRAWIKLICMIFDFKDITNRIVYYTILSYVFYWCRGSTYKMV